MMQVLESSHLEKSSVQETEADKGHESLYYPCQTEAWQFHVTKNRQHESKKKNGSKYSHSDQHRKKEFA